jgi:hypothetical protein
MQNLDLNFPPPSDNSYQLYVTSLPAQALLSLSPETQQHNKYMDKALFLPKISASLINFRPQNGKSPLRADSILFLIYYIDRPPVNRNLQFSHSLPFFRHLHHCQNRPSLSFSSRPPFNRLDHPTHPQDAHFLAHNPHLPRD